VKEKVIQRDEQTLS